VQQFEPAPDLTQLDEFQRPRHGTLIHRNYWRTRNRTYSQEKAEQERHTRIRDCCGKVSDRSTTDATGKDSPKPGLSKIPESVALTSLFSITSPCSALERRPSKFLGLKRLICPSQTRRLASGSTMYCSIWFRSIAASNRPEPPTCQRG
jgi:hypothetical protein